jgi:hypothetical protein
MGDRPAGAAQVRENQGHGEGVQVGDGFEGDGDESAERATLDGDLIAGGRVVAGLVVVLELGLARNRCCREDDPGRPCYPTGA